MVKGMRCPCSCCRAAFPPVFRLLSPSPRGPRATDVGKLEISQGNLVLKLAPFLEEGAPEEKPEKSSYGPLLLLALLSFRREDGSHDGIAGRYNKSPATHFEMSGFSSLLENFKHTTQLAAAAASSSSNASSSSASGTHRSRKRPHNEISDTHIFPTTAVARIFIACPANVETGGPEALHQLCHMINAGEYSCLDNEIDGESRRGTSNRDEFGRSKQGPETRRPIKAYMLYLRERGTSVEHVDASAARSPKYDKYNAPPAEELPGAAHDGSESSLEFSSDLVIWPEVWTHLIDSLQSETGSGKYQSAIWWLSVNNNKGRFTSQQFESRKDILHLVQSAYARHYVRSKLGGSPSKYNAAAGRQPTKRVLMMTEFLPQASPSFAPPAEGKDDDPDARDIDVVYNTAKGMHYADEIIRRACGKKTKPERDGSIRGGGLRFSPIGKGEGGRERLSGEEVVALLRRAKVYVDFGPHPGMDRLPREAALAGCVVLTNREGAAAFDEDVPLPKEHKFSSFDVDKIYLAIKDVCANHKRESAKLKQYREWILGQEKQMKICVDRFVEEVVTNR